MKTVKKLIITFVIAFSAIAFFSSEKPEPSSLTPPIVVVGVSTALPISSEPLMSTETASAVRTAKEMASQNIATSTQAVSDTSTTEPLRPSYGFVIDIDDAWVTTAIDIEFRYCQQLPCESAGIVAEGQRVNIVAFIIGEFVDNYELWVVSVNENGGLIYAPFAYMLSSILPSTSSATSIIPTATQTAIPTAIVQTGLVYYYANASASIRSCPNTDCSLVARLNIGDRIGVLSFVAGQNVYGNSDLWADVTVGNQPQFIYGELLSLTPVQAPVISPPEQNSSPVVPPAAPPVQDSFVCPRNCAEAISLGWTAQQAGRCPNLDRDGDGVACYGD